VINYPCLGEGGGGTWGMGHLHLTNGVGARVATLQGKKRWVALEKKKKSLPLILEHLGSGTRRGGKEKDAQKRLACPEGGVCGIPQKE